MLLSLLPLAGWADDIVVTPGFYSKTYGDNDPAVASGMFSVTGIPAGKQKSDVVEKLSFARIQSGETAGYSYDYTLVWNGEQIEGCDVIVTGNGKLNILAKDISTVAAPTIADQQFHVGDWNAPTFTLAGLTLDTDYEIVGYTNSADGAITGKGDGNKVTVKGINNYKGTATYTFNISALTVNSGDDPIAAIAGVFADYDYTYDGAAKAIPAYTIEENSETDIKTDITEFFEFAEPVELTNAGDKEITATAKAASNYTGSFKFRFSIKAKSITNLEFAAVPDETYTGAAFTPTPSVTDNDVAEDPYVLVSGDAPSYTYDNNINNGTATVHVTGHGNYTGTKDITFQIAKRDLNEINVDAIAAADYTGLSQTPAVTAAATDGITTLPVVYNPETSTGDYTIAYNRNTNASTDAQKATATISAVENSNYTGSKTVEFTINKVNLTVTPKNFTKIIGDADPTNDVLVSDEYYTITGFVNEETVVSAGVTGAPVFTINAHDEAVGTKANAITIADPAGLAGLSAQNYNFVAGAAANLIISPTSAVTIAFKKIDDVTYGDVDALAALTTAANAKNYIDVTGLAEGEEVSSMTIAFVDAEGNAVIPKNVGTYYLKASPATIDLNENDGNYDFTSVEIENGSFQIVARPIAFKAVNQTVTYGEDPVLTTGADRIEQVSGSYAYTDGRSDMNFTLKTENYNGSVGEHTGVLILGATNDNYEITLTNGNILVVAPAGALDLSAVADDDILTKIQDYNNVEGNVVIPFNRAQTLGTGDDKDRSWVAEKWNTLVLPFDITPLQLCQAFGCYAVFNVVDAEKTTEKNVAFKLKMSGTITANTPFLVKTENAISGNITFTGVKISAPATAYPSVEASDSEKGYTFVGAYKTLAVDKTQSYLRFLLGNSEKWAYIKSTSEATWNVVPFAAYVNLTEANVTAAREVTFTMEEIDGSTTTVRSIDTETPNSMSNAEGWYSINGMKMNAAPTQKGVYIKNGKKVIVK